MFSNNNLGDNRNNLILKYVDLFCGIGGFRVALDIVCSEYKIFNQKIEPVCVFSSDIDIDAQQTYEVNFGEKPEGDITKISEELIPSHNLLFAGFPCQPFSICGKLQGFEDTRGTVFFDIVRILEYRMPYAFVLENVKQLIGHDKGKTLKIILEILKNLGYFCEYKVLEEFADLAQVLLNINIEQMEWTELAHIYRVGVTNAADRGLDMWANFVPAIQVKHLTLNSKQVETIVDQVESDCIVIVCRDADASVMIKRLAINF